MSPLARILNTPVSMKMKNGFTLVELMVVVAIIGLLAAIAIPQYQRFLIKAKRAEGIILMDAVNKSQVSYYAMYEEYYPPNAGVGGAIVSPAVGNQFFGLGPTTTRLGWVFQNYRGYAQGIVGKTRGYVAEVTQNWDKDGWMDGIVSQALGYPPNCPKGIPFLAEDDLLNDTHTCM